MVSIPVTHKVKLLYGIGYRTAAIGQVLSIAKKVLALFGKGSATMGPAQVIMLDDSIRTRIRAINPTDAEIQAVFNMEQHVPNQKIKKIR